MTIGTSMWLRQSKEAVEPLDKYNWTRQQRVDKGNTSTSEWYTTAVG